MGTLIWMMCAPPFCDIFNKKVIHFCVLYSTFFAKTEHKRKIF